MAQPSKVTMKEGLQIAQQFAPHTKRVNQNIQHGIPKAQHMSPEVAAARVQKSSAGQLFDSLQGFGAQLIKTTDTVGKRTQELVTKEMQKREMSPEEYGHYADRASLPNQWNPMFMTLYDKSLGEKFARENYQGAFEEVLNREDVYTLSEEQFREEVLTGVKERAGKSGLNVDSETQMLSFSNSLNPALLKGTAEFTGRKSKILGDAAKQDRIASSVAEIQGLDTSNPELFDVNIQRITDTTIASLGAAQGRAVLGKIVDTLAENGNVAQLERMGEMIVDGRPMKEHRGGWDVTMLIASNKSQALGSQADNEWRASTYEKIERADNRAEFDAHMDNAPPSQQARRPEYERAYRAREESLRVAHASQLMEKDRSAMTSDKSAEYWNITKGGGNPNNLDVSTNMVDPRTGERVIIPIKDIQGGAALLAINEATAVLSDGTLSAPQKADHVAQLMKQANRLPNGGSEVHKQVLHSLLGTVRATLGDTTQLEQVAKGHHPDSFATALAVTEKLREQAPESIPKEMETLANGIFNIKDALGMDSLEAAQVYARSKTVNAPKDVKAATKLAAGIVSSSGLSASQLKAVRESIPIMMAAGMSTEDIKSQVQAGESARYQTNLDVGKQAVGRIPKGAVTVDSGYESKFSEWNGKFLKGAATAALQNTYHGANADAVTYEYGKQGVNVLHMGISVSTISYAQVQSNFEVERQKHQEQQRLEHNKAVKREQEILTEETFRGAFARRGKRNAEAGKVKAAETKRIVDSKPKLDITGFAPEAGHGNTRKF